MKDEAGLGLTIDWVQQALISAYEDNCPLIHVKTRRQCLRWTVELESLRRGARRLFNRCRSDKNTQNWALYREAQRNYRKEVGKASKNACRTFCSSINDLPRSARLHRALSRNPKMFGGSIGQAYAVRGGNLRALVNYTFSQFGVTQESAVPAAALVARRPD